MTGIRVAESIAVVGRDAWTRLTQAGGASVFYSWDFLAAVEAQPLSALAKPFYLLVEDAPGVPLAVLPLYFQEGRDPFAAADGPAIRSLVSHVWHCYDTTVPCRTALEPRLVERIWLAVASLADELRADMYGLVNVPAWGPLHAALKNIGLTAQATVPRYRLDLRGGKPGMEPHLATVGRSSRRTLRSYVRRARRQGACVSVADGVRQLDGDVLDLCVATADKHAPGYYPPGPLAALIESLGARCRIVRVDLDGVLLAASICLYDDTRMHAWAGGCRYPDELNWSPQYVLFWSELETAFESGREVLECGRRNDKFKQRYGLTPVPLARFVEYGGAGR
jgi:predicted N-acyltransferase